MTLSDVQSHFVYYAPLIGRVDSQHTSSRKTYTRCRLPPLLLCDIWKPCKRVAARWYKSCLPPPVSCGYRAEGSIWFLANVNSRSRSLYAIARPSVVCLSSVVCNVRAPYSGDSNFLQHFYGIRYLGHPLTFTENFTEIVQGEPLRLGS